MGLNESNKYKEKLSNEEIRLIDITRQRLVGIESEAKQNCSWYWGSINYTYLDHGTLKDFTSRWLCWFYLDIDLLLLVEEDTITFLLVLAALELYLS